MKTLSFISIAMAILLSLPSTKSNNFHNCSASNLVLEVKQHDGSTIQLIGHGNAVLNYAETKDGYTVIEKDGFYEYAQMGVNGALVASGFRANDAETRTVDEEVYLKDIEKHLRHSRPFSKEIISKAETKIKSSNTRFPENGDNKVLVLLIQYPDLPNTYSNLDFKNLMNQPNYNGTGSFKDYFMKNSFGKLNLNTDVFGWYTSEHNHAHYGNYQGNTAAMELVSEAMDAAENSGVDFSKYDNDNNGEVDGIIVIHAGPGAEVGAQNQFIWSQKSTLHQQYSRSYDGVIIRDFIINPETRPWGMVGIGVICHEFGHLLGFPDLYDLDNSSAGIGNWGLMGRGSWLNDEKTPANLCAWAKEKQNWINPIVISDGYHTVMPADFTTTCYKVNTPNPNEYFLIENKSKIGNDLYLPGEGLAIWHIDKEKTNIYPASNLVNIDEEHKGVDLEEADGMSHLDNAQGFGDAGDLFPGSGGITSFSPTSLPNSNTYTLEASGVAISNIFSTSTFVSFILNGDGIIPCDINDVSVLTNANCNNGLFDLEVEVDYVYASTDKQLFVNGNAYDLTGSPQKVTLENLPANGAMVGLEVSIGENSDCGYSNAEFYQSPKAYETNIFETTCNPLEVGISDNYFSSVSGCDSIVTVHTEFIGGKPSFDFDEEGLSVSFFNNTNEVGDFVWFFGDGHLSYETDPIHEYESSGTYQVTLQALKSDCITESTDTVQVGIVTSLVDEALSKKKVNVFPNPANDFVNIELEHNENATIEIQLFDLNGALVLKEISYDGRLKTKLDLTSIDKGSYFLEVKAGEQLTTNKLIKL